TRMREGDAKLQVRHPFDATAKKAQNAREKSFARAYAFTQLIDALKARNPKAAACAALSCPPALLLLWMPLEARLKRLLKALGA
ncbi:MAG: hypothetical protein K2Q01_10035, partial [Rickettsiales bacterium]|nr:hypothetical protein [Rickettsiales bacterium]